MGVTNKVVQKDSEWLNEQQAADWLEVPVAALQQAIESGAIPALKVGELTRISKSALLQLARSGDGASRPSAYSAALDEGAASDGLPLPKGVSWLEDLRPTERFDYKWPNSETENYPRAWKGSITVNGDKYEVKVGEAEREVGGVLRGRLAVFIGGYPACEFVKTPEGDAWASVIKPDGKKTVPPGTEPPALYRRARVMPNREAIGLSGMGLTNALALVIAEDDYRSAVHHGAARRLGRYHFPVEPA
jgi:excisionase family DNA binding protein